MSVLVRAVSELLHGGVVYLVDDAGGIVAVLLEAYTRMTLAEVGDRTACMGLAQAQALALERRGRS